MLPIPFLLAALGVAGPVSTPRSLEAWIGSDRIRLQVARSESLQGGLLLKDSSILVQGHPESEDTWRGGTDTLVGPVRLVRHGRKGWKVPEGARLRRAPIFWGVPTPPPLVVSGDSLCHWGPVVAQLALQDRPATWDSVCFDHSGQVRSARLLSRWEEWHPWISMRVERDSGHRMRGPVFVDPPDRMVLEPDPSFAREPGKEHGYVHEFRWLDESGAPLRRSRILPWSSLDGMPCVRARAGKLDAGVRPRFSSLYRPVCWLALPGSGDTLTEFEDGTNEVSHPGWKVEVSDVPSRDGWTAEPSTMVLRNLFASEGLQYEVMPESYRWRKGAMVWSPVLPDPHGHWLRPSVHQDTIPPLQDPDVVWEVDDPTLPQGDIPVAGFGIARLTNRFRWRAPDSLVVRATLHLEGKARGILKDDSIAIEVAARWDSQGISVDRTGAFRTEAQEGMYLGSGAVLGGARGYRSKPDDRCHTFVLEHDSLGNRVQALCPPGNGSTGLRFATDRGAWVVVDGALDELFRLRLGEPVVLGAGPKQQPRTRRYPPRP
jgi:hypothetical protein